MIRALLAVVILAAVYNVSTSTTPQRKCNKLADIAMVVDESGSIGQADFDKIKTFLSDIVNKFSVSPFGVHFGLVKYSTNPEMVFSLTKFTDAPTMRKHIADMEYRGGKTRTGSALEFTETNIFNPGADRKDVPNIVIIYSDGASHDHTKAKRVTNEMKAKGAEVLCVGIGKSKANARLIRQLQELASKPEYVFETTFDVLVTIENTLVKEVCEAIDPCLAKPCLNNGKCIRTGDDTYKCECPEDHEGPHCELPKFCPKATFMKKGCYDMKDPKYQKLLFNLRGTMGRYEWNEGWNDFVDSIVCRCAMEAKAKGYHYFWIEFYGECWAHKKGLDINKLVYSPDKCWSKRPDPFECNHNEKNPICVGVADTGYLYQLKGDQNTVN